LLPELVDGRVTTNESCCKARCVCRRMVKLDARLDPVPRLYGPQSVKTSEEGGEWHTL